MRIRLTIVGALLLLDMTSCNVKTAVPKYSGNWYGPASFAFDDFIRYYMRLSETLSELDDFLESTKGEVDTAMYCFGCTSQLQQELRSNKVAYEKVSEDSCVFYGLRHGRYKECFVRYSPNYCYLNPDQSCHFLYKDRLQWGRPCFFDSNEHRVSYELEESFMSLIDSSRANYSKYICKPWQDTFSKYHSAFLFEYSDGLKVLDIGSITSSFVSIDQTTYARSTEYIKASQLESLCSDYLTDIAARVSSFCDTNDGISKVIFVAFLCY